jgi:DNA-binding IscR family transcriptional regulator
VAKVFHDLVKRGVLVSVRGTGGGFRLADGAERLTLMDVVEAVDGPWDRSALSDRGLGAPGLPCPLTALLQPVQDQLERLLLTTCVADVAGRASAAANAAPLFCPTGQPQDRPPQGVTKPRADAARCAGLPIYDREDPS